MVSRKNKKSKQQKKDDKPFYKYIRTRIVPIDEYQPPRAVGEYFNGKENNRTFNIL